ncbi:MAG: type II secretion system minor pseudopilin GspJ [Gammaproteobacteria bacterium]|nr:type II secretion system minor pseudopilin GspJ [Gammaproteobacteria bacterium]MDH5730639.1 type II secretion system minor pseudopilin GspJ [Gammaproteobacteria bacterium]
MKKTNTGFTLLELLIAMAIFAILSAMAYGGLNNILNNREQIQNRADEMVKLQALFNFMMRDFEQIIGRGIRDDFGDQHPALVSGGAGTYVIEFTRAGWRNPMLHLIKGEPEGPLKRSNLQRVAYKLDEDKLIRLNWNILDRASDTGEPAARMLFEGVEDIELRFATGPNDWEPQWPPQSDTKKRPMAIELTLNTKQYGKIRRVFRVPSIPEKVFNATTGGVQNQKNQNSQGGANSANNNPTGNKPEGNESNEVGS